MGTPFVGEIRMFAGNFAPAGWMFCNGQLLAISENETLFQLIGTTYGGDGQATFAVPNLQSRIPIHQNFGAGPSYQLSQTGGVETVTLTTQQLPSHTHVPQGQSGNGSSAPTNSTWAAHPTLNIYTDAAPSVNMNAAAIKNTGGSQPHDNMLPYLAVNFIISLFGIFPSPS